MQCALVCAVQSDGKQEQQMEQEQQVEQVVASSQQAHKLELLEILSVFLPSCSAVQPAAGG